MAVAGATRFRKNNINERGHMYKVLTICTGNICRSPMAAGLLEHFLPDELKKYIEVTSAGTHALHGRQAETHAQFAMDQLGIDISKHRARQITKEMARSSDLILAMEAAHVKKIKGLLGWRHRKPRMISEFDPGRPIQDIADPYGGDIRDYQRCIDRLKPCIYGVVEWLKKDISSSDKST
jgi:protein-tyrosine phosphatase